MHPGPVPSAPEAKPPAPSRRATDPVAAVAGNATMLGIGYMLMRRPIAAAVALAGTGFLLWSAAVQTENPLWRFLLPAWGLAMIVHAWWLTRRTRPEPLVDLVEPDPARRPRFFAATAASLVLLTLGWFRFDAWWISRDAETAHAAGDCERATAVLERFDAVHRVAFGPITLRGEEEREACALLLAALDEPPTEAADTVAEYMAHPGAEWDGAGAKRAEFLLDASMTPGEPELSTIEEAFGMLTSTLEEHPDQAGTVRAAVEEFMADLAEAPACNGYAVDDWMAGRTWDEPALAEPVAAASDQVPVRMLQCAQDRTESEDLPGAGILYREFLAAYPGHELAGEAADGILDSGAYCGDPVAYPGAPEYEGAGPHPMRLVGGWTAEGRGFPESWLGATADETQLVVCVDAEVGGFQDSCRYGDGSFTAVFWAHKFTIKAYELRTGELVSEYTREIGDPCPDYLDGTYSTVYVYWSGDMLGMASEFTDAEFRGMFADLVN
ncbi:hypothetical protein [Glycomyces albidus]|uniref:Uncharacterized protein n=1 Tax=Glycomyces albidus TaxID=2656774 RepID=A0A6L5G8J3_9ACTN|nr:hypothetical protein [Glycomyces albidus]MQM26022.1 hypothetical protein [Glycomyces albidus]